MDNLNNENINNENANNNVGGVADNATNNTPNYNEQIYSEPVPQPGQFTSGTAYGSNSNDNTNFNSNYQQAQYNQQPVYNQPVGDLEEPMTLGEWIGTILLTLIPCVNIVLLFVWAFSSTEKKTKSNWAKATLIIAAIGVAIYLILIFALVSAGISMFKYMF